MMTTDALKPKKLKRTEEETKDDEQPEEKADDAAPEDDDDGSYLEIAPEEEGGEPIRLKVDEVYQGYQTCSGT